MSNLLDKFTPKELDAIADNLECCFRRRAGLACRELAIRLRQEEEENRRDPVTEPRPGDRVEWPDGRMANVGFITQKSRIVGQNGGLKITAQKSSAAGRRKMKVIKETAYTAAFGCRFCLHIGSTAFMFGTMAGGRGPRLELFTPRHLFRWSNGYREVQQ